MYNFSLKIDDEEHSLTKEDGISFDKIGELLQSLYDAIDPGSHIKCTLEGVRGNCYALDFTTQEERFVENFIVIHKNIESIPFTQLQDKQKNYATSLRKILGSKYHANAYDTAGLKVASIKDIGTKENYATYYTLKTVYGIVSQLGAKSLDSVKKQISVDGLPYNIKISKDQDIELKQFYASDKLRLKLKQKRSQAKGRVIDAELVSFTKVNGNSLIENLKDVGYIDFDLIKDTHTIEDLVNKIYS